MSPFCFVSIALAVALGLRQTAVESGRGTWLFLLHRPASLRQVLAAKLAVGAGLYLLCGLIAILSYAAWAAMPGKHASPFFWWMTADAWKAWGLIAIVYLAPFWRGFGRRAGSARGSCPWRRAGFSPSLLVFALFWPLLGIAAFLLVAACLVGLIHFTARTRDFS